MRKNKKINGRIIVSSEKLEKEEKNLDTERERVRKKTKRRTVFSWITIIILGVGFCALFGIFFSNLVEQVIKNEETVINVEDEEKEPKVKIIDENDAGMISERTREYIWQLENDLSDLGYKVTRAILPIGKMKEIDINLEGISPYFKVNLERGTAVSAEDIVRMVKYLVDNNLNNNVSYVDVRIEGKAFYK